MSKAKRVIRQLVPFELEYYTENGKLYAKVRYEYTIKIDRLTDRRLTTLDIRAHLFGTIDGSCPGEGPLPGCEDYHPDNKPFKGYIRIVRLDDKYFTPTLLKVSQDDYANDEESGSKEETAG